MTASDDGGVNPVGPPRRDDRGRLRGGPKVATLLGGTALCLASLAVMLPWPVLGIMLTRSSFDQWNEGALLFGGITLFPLMVLAIFNVSASQDLIVAVLMLVWLAAAVVPDLWLRRRLTSWPAIVVLLGVQTMFSLAQALMGALLVIGKSI